MTRKNGVRQTKPLTIMSAKYEGNGDVWTYTLQDGSVVREEDLRFA